MKYFLIFLIVVFRTFNLLYAYTQKDLDASLRYYYKVSKTQKLSPNDKLSILLKIQSKYKNYKLDFSVLNKEIATQRNLLSAQKAISTATPSSAETVPAQSVPAKFPLVKDIKIEDKTDSTNIKIISGKATDYNTFILKDPDPLIPPKIILDLYGVVEGVSQKELRLGWPGIEKIKIGQFEKEPNPIVRTVVFLKKPLNYTVSEVEDGFLISIKKEPEEIASAKKDIPKQTISPAPATGLKHFDDTKKIEYKIEPGDVLAVNIYPAEELSREVVVSPNGEISLPLVGVVNTKNETPEKLSATLRRQYSRYITNPEVSVVVKQYARRQVFITGEVKNTGAVSYKESLRLMELISQSGGFTERANRREVKIYRGSGAARKTFTVDVEELIKTGDFTKDFILEPGDIVEVIPGPKKISVLGEVRYPGYYDYREKIGLLEAISLAGGFTDTAKISRATILRKNNNTTTSIAVNIDDILKGKSPDITLQPDDTVYLPRKTISSATWWAQNILPWLSLISLILVIRAGI